MGEQMGWRADGTRWASLRPFARAMRRLGTPAEEALWRRLRRDQLGVRFRRQVVIGRFIVDFFCPARALAVEVDGSVHDGCEAYDAERERMLSALGIHVVRVRNEEVLLAIDAVLRRIREALTL